MKIPNELSRLVHDKEINASLPLQFQFTKKAFIVDIMLFLDLDDPGNFDADRNLLRFALNGEGFFLLVDLASEDLKVMLEEFGDIDYIGVTVNELLEAAWKPIS